jgi:hypothetical protein
MVPRQQQRDRHVSDAVVDDRASGRSRRLAAGSGSLGGGCRRRERDALLPQVFLDREGHRTLEAGSRQDMARMTGVREPLHDRSEAVRDPGRRIADAVIVNEKKAHD